MNGDKLKKYYENASKHFDLPDYDTFSNDMQDETKRQKMYNASKDYFDMPEYSQFNNDLFSKSFKQPSLATQELNRYFGDPLTGDGQIRQNELGLSDKDKDRVYDIAKKRIKPEEVLGLLEPSQPKRNILSSIIPDAQAKPKFDSFLGDISPIQDTKAQPSTLAPAESTQGFQKESLNRQLLKDIYGLSDDEINKGSSKKAESILLGIEQQGKINQKEYDEIVKSLDTNTKNLEKLHIKINTLKDNIKTPQDLETFNQSIEEYNQLLNQINPSFKRLIELDKSGGELADHSKLAQDYLSRSQREESNIGDLPKEFWKTLKYMPQQAIGGSLEMLNETLAQMNLNKGTLEYDPEQTAIKKAGTWLREQGKLKEKELKPKTGFWGELGSGAATMAIAAPLTAGVSVATGNPVAGFVAGFIPSFVLEGGLAYNEAKEYGLSDKEASLYSLPVGLIGGAIEQLSELKILKKLGLTKKIAQEVTEKLAQKKLLPKIGEAMITGAKWEGIEELSQEITQLISESLYKRSEDLPGLNEILERISTSALYGSILGGFMGGGTALLTHPQSKKIAKDLGIRLKAAEERTLQDDTDRLEQINKLFDRSQPVQERTSQKQMGERIIPYAEQQTADLPSLEELQGIKNEPVREDIGELPKERASVKDSEEVSKERVGETDLEKVALRIKEAGIVEQQDIDDIIAEAEIIQQDEPGKTIDEIIEESLGYYKGLQQPQKAEEVDQFVDTNEMIKQPEKEETVQKEPEVEEAEQTELIKGEDKGDKAGIIPEVPVNQKQGKIEESALKSDQKPEELSDRAKELQRIVFAIDESKTRKYTRASQVGKAISKGLKAKQELLNKGLTQKEINKLRDNPYDKNLLNKTANLLEQQSQKELAPDKDKLFRVGKVFAVAKTPEEAIQFVSENNALNPDKLRAYEVPETELNKNSAIHVKDSFITTEEYLSEINPDLAEKYKPLEPEMVTDVTPEVANVTKTEKVIKDAQSQLDKLLARRKEIYNLMEQTRDNLQFQKLAKEDSDLIGKINQIEKKYKIGGRGKFGKKTIDDIVNLAVREYQEQPAFISFQFLNPQARGMGIKKLEKAGYNVKKLDDNYIKIGKRIGEEVTKETVQNEKMGFNPGDKVTNTSTGQTGIIKEYAQTTSEQEGKPYFIVDYDGGKTLRVKADRLKLNVKETDVISDKEKIEEKESRVKFYEVAPDEVNVNTEAMQNREAKFSKETYNSIIEDVKSGDFDIANIPPVMVYKDKSGKLWTLNHSRLKAYQDLKAEGNEDFQTIPVQEIRAKNLEEAGKLAKEKSNIGAKETPIERAKIYRKDREGGLPEKRIIQKAEQLEGRNKNHVINLSYLNPDGKTITSYSNVGENVSGGRVMRDVADYIGEVRKENKELTDLHEDELFEWLYTNGAMDNFKNKIKFKENIESFIKHASFNPNELLGVGKNKIVRGSHTIEVDKKLESARKRRKDLEKERTDFEAGKTSLPFGLTPKEYLSEISQKIANIDKDILDLTEDRRTAVQSDRLQDDLFSQITEEVENEQAEEIIATRPTEELETLTEDIESKAESEREVDLNEAIRKADAIAKPKKSTPLIKPPKGTNAVIVTFNNGKVSKLPAKDLDTIGNDYSTVKDLSFGNVEFNKSGWLKWDTFKEVKKIVPGEQTLRQSIGKELKEDVQKLFQKVDTPRNLIVVHNTSAEKLRFIDKLGGMAVPSLAVVRKEFGLDNFGDISLVADKSLIDPKESTSNKVYDADVYSPRYPRVDYKTDYKAIEQKAEELFESASKVKDKLDQNEYLADKLSEGKKSAYYGSLEGTLREVKDIQYNEFVRLAFINDNIKDIPDNLGYAKIDEIIKNNRDTFDEYVTKIKDSIVIDERIFKGFTYAGNRRYIALTLENIVKELKGNIRGGESFFYGAGSVRSQVAKQFKSIPDIQKSRDKIKSSEEVEKIKNRFQDELSELYDDAGVNYEGTYSSPRSEFQYTIIDAAKSSNPRLVLEKNGFGRMDVDRVEKFLQDLNDAPTEYFEAKIQRGVQLNEFIGAIVPKGTTQKTLDLLKKNGINQIEFYDPNIEGDRKKALNKFEQVLFQDISERNDLQKLQDRKRHLELVIDEAGKKNNTKAVTDAKNELREVNRKLSNRKVKESQFDIFGDAQDQESLFQKNHNKTRTAFNKLSPKEQTKFLNLLEKMLADNWGVEFKNLTKEQAAGVTHLLRNMIELDPDTANLTTVWEEAFHQSMVALAKPFAARNMLREAGWNGKGEIWDVANNETLRDAHEKLAKDFIKWAESSKEPSTRTEKVFALLKDLWNKIAAFLYQAGFHTHAGYFEMLYSGKLKASAEGINVEDLAQSLAQEINREENFKRWFKGSKVIDSKGEPLIVYHGTASNFDSFNKGEIGKVFKDDKDGFYFTNNVSFMMWNSEPVNDMTSAGAYANNAANIKNNNWQDDSGSQIYPVFLSIKNPYIIDSKDYADGFNDRSTVDWLETVEGKNRIIKIAKAEGHDGLIIIDRSIKFKNGEPEKLIIAFNPSQIKSIFNRGTFDPNDANILNQKIEKDYPDMSQSLFQKLPQEQVNERLQQRGKEIYTSGKTRYAEWVKEMRKEFGQGISYQSIYLKSRERIKSVPEEDIEKIKEREIKPEPEEKAIGLNKAEIKFYREELDLNDLETPQRKAILESLNEAKERGLKDSALETADLVIKERRLIEPAEHAGMVMKAKDLRDEYNELNKQASEFVDKGNLVTFRAIEARKQVILDQLDKLTLASDLGGTELGRALNIRKLRVKGVNYDIASVLQRARIIKGSKLTAEETQQFEELAKRYEESEKELAKLKDDYEKLQSEKDRLQAERVARNEVRKAKKEGITEKATVRREKILKERTDIKKQLSALGYRLNDVTGLTAEGSYLVGRLALNYIKEGAVNLNEVVQKVLADMPDLTERDVWRALNSKDPNRQVKLEREVQKRISQIKSQAKILEDIKKAEEGIFEKPKPRIENQAAEVKRLRKLLTNLRSEAYKSELESRKLEKALQTINELQDQLANNYRSLRKRTPLTNEEIDVARDKIKELRKLMNLEDTISYTHEFESLREQFLNGKINKETYLNKIEQLNADAFKIREKKETVQLPPEIMKKAAEVYSLKKKINNDIRRLKPRTDKDRMVEVINSMRTIKATMDMSSALRQGFFPSVRRPKLFAETQAKAMKAFFDEKTYNEIMFDIESSPNHYLRVMAGLDLTDIDASPNEREEMFASELLEKIPVYGAGVKASNRHMTTTLNLLRVGIFDEFVGKYPNATMEELKAWANYVNVATGRGTISPGVAQKLALFFFAPKFAVSRIQTPYMLIKHWEEPRVRKEIAKDYAAFGGLAATALGLAILAGFKVGDDPDDPDFGKIVIGNTRVDMFAGIQQPMRILFRIAKQGTNKLGLTESIGREETPIEMVQRFVGYKLAPAVTLLHELWTGKSIIGEERTPLETLGISLVPMVIEDSYEAYQDGGITRSAWVSVLNFYGMTANTYERNQDSILKESGLGKSKEIKAIREKEKEIKKLREDVLKGETDNRVFQDAKRELEDMKYNSEDYQRYNYLKNERNRENRMKLEGR